MLEQPEIRGRISNLKCHNKGTKREYWTYDIYLDDKLVISEKYATGTREQVIAEAIKIGNFIRNCYQLSQEYNINMNIRNLGIIDNILVGIGDDRGHYWLSCDLPACENGDRIEIGSQVYIGSGNILTVTAINRCGRTWKCEGFDQDGDEHSLYVYYIYRLAKPSDFE